MRRRQQMERWGHLLKPPPPPPTYCWLSSGRFGLGLLTVHLTEEEGVDSEEDALGIGEVSSQIFCSSF